MCYDCDACSLYIYLHSLYNLFTLSLALAHPSAHVHYRPWPEPGLALSQPKLGPKAWPVFLPGQSRPWPSLSPGFQAKPGHAHHYKWGWAITVMCDIITFVTTDVTHPIQCYLDFKASTACWNKV